MNIFFVITIDTEIDKSLNWKVSSDETFFSVLDGIPNVLTPLFYQFRAKPTYLLSSEVIENNDCVRVLKDVDNCELGTHLHGDLVGPQRRVFKLANNETSEMQCSYSKEIEYQKLRNLTILFKERFGHQPTSFRAGRFGAGINTIPILEELGYYPEGRANFLKARIQPYFPHINNLLETGDSRVLEVPVSIISSRFRRNSSILNNTKVPILVRGIFSKIFPARWLRPSFQTSDEMLYVIKKLMKMYYANENIILNMMFHSMEIIPNASPYSKTEEECQLFLNKMGSVFQFCISNNTSFVTLSELYPIYVKNRE
jgi:hypothetical protein